MISSQTEPTPVIIIEMTFLGLTSDPKVELVKMVIENSMKCPNSWLE